MRRKNPPPDLDPTVCFRLSAAVLVEIDKRAAAERRTRSQYLRNLVNDALAARKVMK